MKLFVTGTDTGVGKTLVACALLLKSQGQRTLGLKPVAAGCDDRGRNADALALRECASLKLPYEQINPLSLEAPMAPHIAAARQGLDLQAAEIAGAMAPAMSLEVDLLVVEGAGGWRVPLNERQSMADVAKLLDLPALLVVDMRLGCLNHALLSAEAVAADGVPLAGWVATSAAGSKMEAYEENLDALRQALPAPCWGVIPPLASPSPQAAAAHLLYL